MRHARSPRLNPWWEVTALAMAVPLGLVLGWYAPHMTRGASQSRPRVTGVPAVPPYSATPGPARTPPTQPRRASENAPPPGSRHPAAPRLRSAVAAQRTFPPRPARTPATQTPPAADPFITAPPAPTGVLLPATTLLHGTAHLTLTGTTQ